MVGVEEGGDTGLEFRIVGNLHEHVDVSLSLLVVMPHGDLVDGGWGFEVDLHPLLAGHEFNEGTVSAIGIAVGDEIEVANDRGGVGTGDFLAFGKVGGALGDHDGLHHFAWVSLFKVRELSWHWSADKHGLGELEFDFFEVTSRGGGRRSSSGATGFGFFFLAAGGKGDGEREAREDVEGVFHGEWLDAQT